MKKMVLKLDLHDEKAKQKAMRIVSGLVGVDSISMDMKDKKMTVIGDIDAVCIVRKLRKLCCTEVVSVGEAKEEKKKEEPKKDDAKKADGKKKDPKEELAELMKACQAYQNNPPFTYYCVRNDVEENPNVCVIS